MKEFMVANLAEAIKSFDLMVNEERREEITSLVEELFNTFSGE